jgi:hypothetical protein
MGMMCLASISSDQYAIYVTLVLWMCRERALH